MSHLIPHLFMDEQCKAALELLVQNGYLEPVKGKYRCTAKLNDAVKVGLNGEPPPDWEALYIKFIKESGIPSLGENGMGDNYKLNQYSTDGMKRFRQMLEKEQIQLPVLIKVTRAYYTGSSRYKKKIGNYMTENLWRMDYEILKNQTEQQQQQTLQKQQDESKPFTRDRIG